MSAMSLLPKPIKNFSNILKSLNILIEPCVIFPVNSDNEEDSNILNRNLLVQNHFN